MTPTTYNGMAGNESGGKNQLKGFLRNINEPVVSVEIPCQLSGHVRTTQSFHQCLCMNAAPRPWPKPPTVNAAKHFYSSAWKKEQNVMCGRTLRKLKHGSARYLWILLPRCQTLGGITLKHRQLSHMHS